MRIKIQHTSRYKYKSPPDFVLQKVRLTPLSDFRQEVEQWQLNVGGATTQVTSRDAFGNEIVLLRADADTDSIEVSAQGTIVTSDTKGVMERSPGVMPLFVYTSFTELTSPNDEIIALAESTRKDDHIDMLHRLMDTIAETVEYEPGATHVGTTAADALAGKKGVCQDLTHIFLAAARHLDLPARYTSGYFVSGNDKGGDASHGWAEVFVPDLGWVGFDPTNRRCPDERYVRIAAGRDYTDVSPVSGVRVGAEGERLTVTLDVEQQ
ncbi:transglutaminase family protein [Notoacmeibacter ruber]|uniref:Transglutaminase family protein n=1 Tax=Notoacmeibacter ruber TaxID=2670375 RepID=A0A3L7JDW9_9HYPH|nr:transglutaminase family protein [Notoacmeibacter ruber]RLQ87781.1 transglutaminase family protein [Notoacmeibacter ruber]